MATGFAMAVSQFHSEPDVGVRAEIGNKIVNRNED